MKRDALLVTSLSTLATIACSCLHRLKAMEVSPILEVGLPKDPSSSYPLKLATKYAHIVPAGRVVKKVAFISATDILDLEPHPRTILLL